MHPHLVVLRACIARTRHMKLAVGPGGLASTSQSLARGPRRVAGGNGRGHTDAIFKKKKNSQTSFSPTLFFFKNTHATPPLTYTYIHTDTHSLTQNQMKYRVPVDLMTQPPPLDLRVSVGDASVFRVDSLSATCALSLVSRASPRTIAARIKITLPVPNYVVEASRLATSNAPYIQGELNCVTWKRIHSHDKGIIDH